MSRIEKVRRFFYWPAKEQTKLAKAQQRESKKLFLKRFNDLFGFLPTAPESASGSFLLERGREQQIVDAVLERYAEPLDQACRDQTSYLQTGYCWETERRLSFPGAERNEHAEKVAQAKSDFWDRLDAAKQQGYMVRERYKDYLLVTTTSKP